MKISTKGRYALRLMLELALMPENKPVSLRDISEKQGISDKYLEQLIKPLVKAGFIKSVRGVSGGYYLSRTPSEYTAYEILNVAEGSLAPTKCVSGENGCERADFCVSIDLWREIYDAIANVLLKTSLQDLVDRYHVKKDKFDGGELPAFSANFSCNL